MQKHNYGWVKEPHDANDWHYRDTHMGLSPIVYKGGPLHISLRDKFPEPWNQGNLESCTAHGSLACYLFEHGGDMPSRLEQFWNTRSLEGTTDQDTGAYIRDAMKSLATFGVGPESDWPYDESKVCVKPPTKIIQESGANKIVTYSRLTSSHQFKTCLMQGYPFTIGVSVYDSFESEAVAATGVLPVPNPSAEQLLGGHCITIIGFQSNLHNSGVDYYEFRNSWGAGWGDHGYGWIPAAYMENSQLGSDAWTIRK